MRWSRTFTVVGCHAEGEVGNVITGGVADVPGETMFEKKDELVKAHKDAAFLSLDNQLTGGSPIPFHPGALRYFKEKGLKVN